MEMGPYSDFESASRAVLTFLYERMGFDLWMVTRTEGEDWIVLQSEDHGYGVKDGAVFRWADSFCSRMVLGLGPCIAPTSDDVPAYKEAPIGQQVPIGAYIGLPLLDAEGSLFGTLCAIAPMPQPRILHDELPLLQLLGNMLSTLLVSELKLSSQQRRTEIVSKSVTTDAVTGLLNQASWDRIAAAEEHRCRIYGYPASIIAVRIEGLTLLNTDPEKQLASRAADIIRSVLSDNDSAAFSQSGDFLLMAAERNAVKGEAILKQLQSKFQTAGVAARFGFATRNPEFGIPSAIDVAMQMIERGTTEQTLARNIFI